MDILQEPDQEEEITVMECRQPPPGYRFYPTEEELISFYLHYQLQFLKQQHQTQHCRITTTNLISHVIPLLDIYRLDPWHLPKLSGKVCREDTEQWFFFVMRQEREVRGGRPSRTTVAGYWKATGSPGHVYSGDGNIIGVKKSMVFYKGKAPTGHKTKWKMNEYRAIKYDSDASVPRLRNEVCLCRVYVVSGSTRAFDRRPEPPPPVFSPARME